MAIIDQALSDYIHASRLEGFSDQMIREALLQKGWQPHTLNDAFAMNSLLARAPLPPAAELAAAPEMIPVPKPASSLLRPTAHSPFSIVLAVVLFLFLLVLGYHAIGDLDSLFMSVIAELVIDIVIIIPFVLVAIGLHAMLLHDKSKYRSLTVPFFAASAWLVLKLLVDISQYVYSNVAVYGVYIVLLIAVIVLTATTVFLQKYRGRM